MTPTEKYIPDGFRPFEVLTVCSNMLRNGKAPFLFGQTIPLLVGVGEKCPLVWLSAPADPKGSTWVELVEAGKELKPEGRVYRSVETGETSILVNRLPVIECRQVDEHTGIISFLDLRPCNLNVFGDQSGLSVGLNRFSKNGFQAGYMMRIG